RARRPPPTCRHACRRSGNTGNTPRFEDREALAYRPPVHPSLARRVAAEIVATAFLLAAVVGSGIMGDRLSGGNVGLALLANTLVTGAALLALIVAFGPVSGAH